jgi:glycosyltransferase involved in cell wall biosynthesis
MKIAVNLLPFRKQIAGAGKYAQKILQELSLIDHQNDYFLFVSNQGKKNFENLSKNFHFVSAKFNPKLIIIRILWEQFVFPFKLRKLKPDIIFTPSVAIPFFYKGKFFTTIHDVAYKKNKNKYPFLRRIYISFVTFIAAKKSHVIFTVSNFSKNEIKKEFKLKNKEILVTYNGVNEIFFNEYSDEEKLSFMKKYDLPYNVILYVGAIEPGKNLDKLLLAFSEFVKKDKLNFHLVLTSGIGWKQQFLAELLSELRIQSRVLFLPYIPEKELPLLYKCAQIFVYLSTYEGFGIPVLEALASGLPVIASKSKAIVEFAGEGIIPVDPFNISEIVDSMFKVINDRNFVISKIKEGVDVAKKFKWSYAAKIIYEQIIFHSTRN